MDKISGKLTIFFEELFWIGKLSVCKVKFSGETKDYEIYA